MIAISTFAAAILAGWVYVVVPGPATLASLTLAASQGRGAAARFFAAHLLGDILWSVLALLAMAGVSRLGPGLFDALGLACAAYLIVLGIRALRPGPAGAGTPVVGNPLRAGLAFGLTNPKSYPFALAMLTALLGRDAAAIGLAQGAQIMAGLHLRLCLGGASVIFWTGLAPIRRLYARHARLVGRAMGALFIAFGLKSGHDAIAGFRGGHE